MMNETSMTIPNETPLRLRLVLGKVRVAKLKKGLTGFTMTLDMGGSVTMNVDISVLADVRLGDLLTLYTEVLADVSHPAPPPEA